MHRVPTPGRHAFVPPLLASCLLGCGEGESPATVLEDYVSRVENVLEVQG